MLPSPTFSSTHITRQTVRFFSASNFSVSNSGWVGIFVTTISRRDASKYLPHWGALAQCILHSNKRQILWTQINRKSGEALVERGNPNCWNPQLLWTIGSRRDASFCNGKNFYPHIQANDLSQMKKKTIADSHRQTICPRWSAVLYGKDNVMQPPLWETLTGYTL